MTSIGRSRAILVELIGDSKHDRPQAWSPTMLRECFFTLEVNIGKQFSFEVYPCRFGRQKPR